MQARKIVISGEVAGLQIQLGAPAFPGRFDSCDLPPKILYLMSITTLASSYRKYHYHGIHKNHSNSIPQYVLDIFYSEKYFYSTLKMNIQPKFYAQPIYHQ